MGGTEAQNEVKQKKGSLKAHVVIHTNSKRLRKSLLAMSRWETIAFAFKVHKLKPKLQLVLFALGFLISTLSQPALCRDAALSLDLLNADHSMSGVLKPYMIQLRQAIESRWVPRVTSTPRKTKVFLQLRRSGEVLQLSVEQPSGDPSFDDSAMQAIQDSVPFSALPSNAIGLLDIDATFDSRFLDSQDLMHRAILRQNNSVGNRYPSIRPVSGYQAARTEPLQSQYSDLSPAGASAQQSEPLPDPSFRDRSGAQAATEASSLDSNTESDADFAKDPRFKYKDETASSASANSSKAPDSVPTGIDFKFLTSRQKNNLSAEERESYEQDFQSWLQQPPEVRFGMKLINHATKSGGSKVMPRKVR